MSTIRPTSQANRNLEATAHTARDLAPRIYDGAELRSFYGRERLDIDPPDFSATDSVSELAELPAIREVFSGAMASRHLLLIAGPKKCFKTSIALDLVASIATGTSWLGHFQWKSPGRYARCFVVSMETRGRALGRAIEKAIDSKHVSEKKRLLACRERIFAIHRAEQAPNLRHRSHVDALISAVARKGCQFVVLDPLLRMLRDVELFSHGHVGDVLGYLEDRAAEEGITIIACTHNKESTRKWSDDDKYIKPSLDWAQYPAITAHARQWICVMPAGKYDERWNSLNVRMVVGSSLEMQGGDYNVIINQGLQKTSWSATVRETWVAAKKSLKQKLKEEQTECEQRILKRLQEVPGHQIPYGVVCRSTRNAEAVGRLAANNLVSVDSDGNRGRRVSLVVP